MQSMKAVTSLGLSILARKSTPALPVVTAFTMPTRSLSTKFALTKSLLQQPNSPWTSIPRLYPTILTSFSNQITSRPLSSLCSRLGQRELMAASKNVNLGSDLTNSAQLRRTLTTYSFLKGKRKSVKSVLKRFYRLDWGIWIRPRAGRHRKLWKKNSARKKRAREHVFCNATQSYMLDKMVAKFWRTPKYYVDDPYESYHTRDSFGTTARPKPSYN